MTGLKIYRLDEGDMIVYSPSESKVLYSTKYGNNPDLNLSHHSESGVKIGEIVYISENGEHQRIALSGKVIKIKDITREAYQRIKDFHDKQDKVYESKTKGIREETQSKIEALKIEEAQKLRTLSRPNLEFLLDAEDFSDIDRTRGE